MIFKTIFIFFYSININLKNIPFNGAYLVTLRWIINSDIDIVVITMRITHPITSNVLSPKIIFGLIKNIKTFFCKKFFLKSESLRSEKDYQNPFCIRFMSTVFDKTG